MKLSTALRPIRPAAPRLPARAALARWLGISVLTLALIACATPPTATSSPSVPPPNGSPSDGAGAFELRRAPADLGCDAIGVPYRSVTFRIDPAASEPVWAVADTGTTLRTFWSNGFEARALDIVDPSGAVVVRDGDTLAVPAAAWPRLHGYFVCPSPDALYILIQDPA